MKKAQQILAVMSMFGGPSLAGFLPRKREREEDQPHIVEEFMRKAEEKRLRKAQKRKKS